jgi:hypothetical protein
MKINIYVLIGVVLIWLFALTVLFCEVGRECHGQCYQTNDQKCQQRCHDKGICPLAGGDR